MVSTPGILLLASEPCHRTPLHFLLLINNLEEKFQLYDNQLSTARRKADSLIDQIEETFHS